MSIISNPYFYKPFSLARSNQNVYVLCKSYSYLLFKITRNKDNFKFSSNSPVKVNFKEISNAWDLGYLVILDKFNIIQLIMI